MKKVLQIILIVILVVITLFLLYIMEESIRIKYGGQYPLIIIGDKTTCNFNNIEPNQSSYIESCQGIGYRVEREYSLGGMTDEEDSTYKIVKEEFWIFKNYLLWGWVA